MALASESESVLSCVRLTDLGQTVLDAVVILGQFVAVLARTVGKSLLGCHFSLLPQQACVVIAHQNAYSTLVAPLVYILGFLVLQQLINLCISFAFLFERFDPVL